jgi:hypothetical protein
VTKQVQQLGHVIIRFAGDSGDGMQLGGDRFTQETAIFGTDLSTLPNFPAEIHAPAGTTGRRPHPCSPWPSGASGDGALANVAFKWTLIQLVHRRGRPGRGT